MCRRIDDFEFFVLSELPSLEVVNGRAVTKDEHKKADKLAKQKWLSRVYIYIYVEKNALDSFLIGRACDHRTCARFACRRFCRRRASCASARRWRPIVARWPVRAPIATRLAVVI